MPSIRDTSTKTVAYQPQPFTTTHPTIRVWQNFTAVVLMPIYGHFSDEVGIRPGVYAGYKSTLLLNPVSPVHGAPDYLIMAKKCFGCCQKNLPHPAMQIVANQFTLLLSFTLTQGGLLIESL